MAVVMGSLIKSVGRFASAGYLITLLVGCASGYAPVTDRSIRQHQQVEIARSSQLPLKAVPTHYRVKKGDTLYSIAWRYGLDYRALARHNKIDSRYRIYAGQVLRLQGDPTATLSQSQSQSQSQSAPATLAVKEPGVLPTPVQPAPAVRQVPQAVKPAAAAVKASSPAKLPVPEWRWPAGGAVISHFNSKNQLNKGIDIAGKLGDPVFAAASGKVVYAGNGLLGYGNLIIINHNHDYLSAYAHNSRILVAENDNVKVGDKVAEIGNSGATKVMLHFEIRKDGKPVNPLKYLPRR